MKKWLLILLSLFVYTSVWADNDSLSIAERNAQMGFNDTIDRLADDFVEAYVAVAEPGDYLYTTFGHVAFHLKCPTFNLDYYYTMESENEPKLLLRLLAGDLKMGLLYFPAEFFLESFSEEKRGVKEWKLNLTPLQKQQLWALLEGHVQEWQDLPYDYYHRGCAITMVNIIHELVGRENIQYAEPWPERLQGTVREVCYNALRGNHEWTQFIMCLSVGDEIDKEMPYEQKLIVPMDLVEVWQKATIDGRPILDPEPIEMLPAGTRTKSTWCTPLLVSIGLLILALLSFGTLYIQTRWMKTSGIIIDYTILGIVTLIGLFMTYLLLFSQLPCTTWNWLYIAFNPLPAIFWHWRRYWALPYAILMLVWIVGMLCAPHMLALYPHLIIICAFIIVLLKEYKINH